MKKIYVQKRKYIFVNSIGILFLAIALYGGIAIDKSMFFLAFVSLGLFFLSLLFLVNKIYYDQQTIRFSLTNKKITINYEDIKEAFVQYDAIVGAHVIINLEQKTDGQCSRISEYTQLCRAQNISHTISIVGVTKKDLSDLMMNCSCEIKGFKI